MKGRPALEVADIFREHGPAWREAQRGHLSLVQLKVMSAIVQCCRHRTNTPHLGVRPKTWTGYVIVQLSRGFTDASGGLSPEFFERMNPASDVAPAGIATCTEAN